MGLIRSIGTRLASRALRSVAKKVARKELDKLAARAVTETSLEALLADCIAAAGGQDRHLVIKTMDTAGASNNYRLGCYVHVQNFDRLASAQARKDARLVRLSFRAVQYKDRPQAWLEALVWQPSHGHADAMKFIFKTEVDEGRDMFVQLLATALHITAGADDGMA